MDLLVRRLSDEQKNGLKEDAVFQKALAEEPADLPKAFSRIEEISGRSSLETALNAEISKPRVPGSLAMAMIQRIDT